MLYSQALSVTEEQGYTLHPIYINNGPKNSVMTYSGTTIGVSVSDIGYDPLKGGTQGLSFKATITEVIDVGGQDSYDRGQVKISQKE